jgi:RimJ/RimL family protein N-acetyltransferase
MVSAMNKAVISMTPQPVATQSLDTHAFTYDWRRALPVLSAGEIVLREVQTSDAPSLKSFLTTPETARFISAPPSTVDGFEAFIRGSRRARTEGRGACFAITFRGSDVALGIVQVRTISRTVDDPALMTASIPTAEWGFALGAPFWGTGIFQSVAALAIEFAFACMEVQRLEARCAVENVRGRRALQKVGARPEGILRNAFLCRGAYLDQMLYAIADDEWRACCDRAAAAATARIH